jgi:predicted DNA-binding transcriptional regulator AlpA
MKATKIKVVNKGQCDTLKSEHCDRQCDNHCDNHPSERVKIHNPRGFITCHTGISTVTRKNQSTVTRKSVTLVVTVVGNYDEGLRMSKQSIKAVWLTVERVAELKGCSVRTVWRYIRKDNMLTFKEQVAIGNAKVPKTFVMPDPELLSMEMQDCINKGMEPSDYLELKVKIKERKINSALIYGYREKTELGGDHETL